MDIYIPQIAGLVFVFFFFSFTMKNYAEITSSAIALNGRVCFSSLGIWYTLRLTL